jgi:membrane fusion protein, heavy metal efflux system
MMESLVRRKKQVVIVLVCVLLGSAFAVTVLARKGTSDRKAVPGNAAADKESVSVSLSPEKLGSSGVEVARISRTQFTVPLAATAAIELNADRASRVSSRVTGRIIKVLVSQGDRVKAGQPLAFIDTVELDQIWAEYRKTKGRCELARKNLKREEALFEKNVAPEKDVLKARQDLSEAEADLVFSTERFRLLGVDVTSIENQKNGAGTARPHIPIISSVGGVVIEKSVTQGEVVNPEKPLFVVADLTTLWVLVDVYEKDMSKLRPGALVNVSVNAFPREVFQGRISYIGDVVNDRTRTIKARVSVDNSDGFLKPGMFAAVSINAGRDAGPDLIIAVPEEAVLIDGTDRYVFVRTGEGRFRRADVTLGRPLGKKVEVTWGLSEGDLLVVKGAFALKSEYKKRSLNAG